MQFVRLVHRDFQRARNNLSGTGETAGRRQNQGKLFRGYAAVLGSPAAQPGWRQLIDLQHQRRAGAGTRTRWITIERFLTRQDAAGRRTQGKERALACAMRRTPTCILPSQTGADRVIGVDLRVCGPVFNRARRGQAHIPQSSGADLCDQTPGFHPPMTSDARIDDPPTIDYLLHLQAQRSGVLDQSVHQTHRAGVD